MEEDRLKKIAGLREILEDRVRTLEAEVEGLRILLEFANTILLEQSFKRVETVKLQPPAPVHEKPTQLQTSDGEVLADLYLENDSMRIVLAPENRFNVKTPPFMPFLHDRVLLKMQEKDQKAAEEGKIPYSKALSFEIELEGDLIREITIQKVDPERRRELVSAIHWTLEKMYQKMSK